MALSALMFKQIMHYHRWPLMNEITLFVFLFVVIPIKETA